MANIYSEITMKLVTPKQMRDIDNEAIKDLAIPGVVLMENAGRGCTDEMEARFGPLSSKKIVILCGRGNNGGDGFVIARHCLNRGASVSVFLLGRKEDVSKDAKINLDILLRMGFGVTEVEKKKDIPHLRGALSEGYLVVDAIFGTGFKGKVLGITKEVIEVLNSSNLPVISIDIPSGMSGDDGSVGNVCVRANLTCTMCLPKRGLYLYPGRLFAGEIKVIDIGVPSQIFKDIPVELTETTTLKKFIPGRPPYGHKGIFGRVLILAGSPGMTGAAALSSLSALRTGAGLVYLGIPESLNHILEQKATEVVTIPLPETSKNTISPSAIGVLEKYPKPDVVVIGPGMGIHEETGEFIIKVMDKTDVPILIDADGLNNLKEKDIVGVKKKHLILTPHPGELSRLIGTRTEDINRNRIDIAISLSKKWRVTLVLKGAPTVIASNDRCYVNTTGSSALATAGSGDVLTGIIAGLCAQGMETFSASALGVYIHGLSGDISAREKTEYGVIAGDVMENIPRAIYNILK